MANPKLLTLRRYLIELFLQAETGHPDTFSSLGSAEEAEKARRYASFAALCFAIVSLAANIVFPPFARFWRTNLGANPYPITAEALADTSLLSLWIFGQLLFGFATLATLFVRSRTQGIILVSFLGVPWALTNWIPHALVGKEVIKVGDSAAVLTTIHNSFISAPQILAAILCSGVLAGSQTILGGDGVAILLRASGLLSLLTASLTLHLRSEICRRSLHS